ncbi:MAG: hypothetical protein GX564_11220 [Oligosphaeraceae bacterium]|nr:hypothetical protein [Oligosphaeraceae bacterium]
MKFAIGYQQPENGESFTAIVNDYRPHIAEVFFPWVGAASCRSALGKARGALDWQAQNVLEEDLHAIRASGVKLDLLFNANCYGARAVSVSLENEVMSIVSHLHDLELAPDIVTTTSPFIARTLKKYCPDIEVRASVNMRIGTTSAMEYLADLFDSFYIQRDIQRDIPAVLAVKKWCDANGKGLYMLANSGCLRYCPSQTFHDNMVAHDDDIDEMKNVEGWTPHLCWRMFGKQRQYEEFLRETWVRPEDIELYDDIFPVVKLATRQHSHPRMVIGAYVKRSFNGNLLNLLEPGHAAAFLPYIIDNQRFPPDWREIATACAANCRHCGRCTEVLKQVLVKQPTEPI